MKKSIFFLFVIAFMSFSVYSQDIKVMGGNRVEVKIKKTNKPYPFEVKIKNTTNHEIRIHSMDIDNSEITINPSYGEMIIGAGEKVTVKGNVIAEHRGPQMFPVILRYGSNKSVYFRVKINVPY